MGLYVFNWPISVLDDWKDISIAHVIIIIKSEVSTFPIVIIFSVVVCLRCLLHHIMSLIACTFRENREFAFIIIVQFMMSANIWIRFGLQLVFVCFVQYTISLSSLCKLIWRHWTYKMLVRYILSSVWLRLSIFSPLSIIQYVGLYVFSLPISLAMIERIYILCLIIIIKSEFGTITLCLGLGHETMVSAVCLSIFLWICDMAGLLRGTFVSLWYLPRIWPSVTLACNITTMLGTLLTIDT